MIGSRHRRLRLLGLLAALVTGLGIGVGHAQQSFVAGVEDLPLMSGLNPRSGSGSVFDTAAGRVVETYAEGRVPRTAVLNYYANTLPALGWERLTPTTFRRESETLLLEFPRANGGRGVTVVRFYLSPG